MIKETAVSIADRLLTANSGWIKEYHNSYISWINDELEYELELWVLDLKNKDYRLESAVIESDKLYYSIDVPNGDLEEFNVFSFTGELNPRMTIKPNYRDEGSLLITKELDIPTGEFDFSLELFEEVITKILLS